VGVSGLGVVGRFCLLWFLILFLWFLIPARFGHLPLLSSVLSEWPSPCRRGSRGGALLRERASSRRLAGRRCGDRRRGLHRRDRPWSPVWVVPASTRLFPGDGVPCHLPGDHAVLLVQAVSSVGRKPVLCSTIGLLFAPLLPPPSPVPPPVMARGRFSGGLVSAYCDVGFVVRGGDVMLDRFCRTVVGCSALEKESIMCTVTRSKLNPRGMARHGLRPVSDVFWRWGPTVR